MDEVLAAAKDVDWSKLAGRSICDACLGRLFGKLGHGHTNEERGRAVRGIAAAPEGPCWLCEGLMSRYDALARLAAKKLAPWDYDTFLIGSKVDPEVRAREESLWSELGLVHPEAIKSEVNREVGKRVCDLTEKEPDLGNPDLVAVVDTSFDHVDLHVNPLYLRGRYRKLVRGIPQTRWPCKRCMGKGCARCGGTGKMYPTSVEEIIAGEVMRESGGTGHALHGMGREDIDARMLGTGRPFVLELKEPKRRALDYPALGAQVAALSGGRVEALEVALSDSGAPERYKAADPAKTYHARCMLEAPVATDMLTAAVAALDGAQLEQRTPERVSHRRADLVRKRRILGLRLVAHEGTSVEFEIRAESGTYIKEFVSGDDGRTRPSMANTLGVGIRVQELDVVAIDWTEPPSV